MGQESKKNPKGKRTISVKDLPAKGDKHVKGGAEATTSDKFRH
jgi:hypothetical protein